MRPDKIPPCKTLSSPMDAFTMSYVYIFVYRKADGVSFQLISTRMDGSRKRSHCGKFHLAMSAFWLKISVQWKVVHIKSSITTKGSLHLQKLDHQCPIFLVWFVQFRTQPTHSLIIAIRLHHNSIPDQKNETNIYAWNLNLENYGNVEK